jgi:uncharacterized membrane protein
MAIPAIAAGFIELVRIDSKTDAFRVATTHMMVMASASTLFLFALVLPLSAGLDHSLSDLLAVASAVVGFLVMAVGGWLGGRLVYEFGIGRVDRKLDRRAPSKSGA